MQHEFMCQKKDKRLLVLFALGILILFSDMEILAHNTHQQKNRAWLTIQSQNEVTYGVDIVKDFSSGNLKRLVRQTGNKNEISGRLESGRAHAIQTNSDTQVQLKPGSPRLAFFLGQQGAINSAEAEDLTLIHGIGPALANKIVAYRETQGPIINAMQLEDIQGIGPKTRQKLEHYFIFTVASK